MAVSGSKDYAVTRAQIIESALRKTGQFDQGESIPGDEVSAAALALNLMTKEWVARGVDIWLRDQITLFLQPNTREYALGTANATSSFVETTLSAAISGVTVIPVVSSAGMTSADFLGVKLDDNTIQWTTISSVDSATQITVADPIGAASSAKKVYAYTTKAGRPQKIVYAYRRDNSGLDTEITVIGEKEYLRQSNKGSAGPPVEVWYQPTLTTGSLFVWPVDGGSNWDKVVLTANYMPDDFDISSNNPQFPIEWANTIIWNLAAELGSEYGLPEREQGRLWSIAEHKLEEMLNYDVENADVQFVMDAQR